MIAVPATREEITKEWFQQVLDNAKEDVVVEDVKVEDGTKAGENFAALVLRAKVTGKKAGEPWNQSFILKIMPVADWAKKMMAEKKVFHKEVEAYNEIIPYMISVQDSEDKLIPDVPRCYFANTDEENNGILVLEDLRPMGYQLADLKKGQDVDHCKLLLRNLAKFHALGYKCRFSSKEPITEKFEGLQHFLFQDMKAELQPLAKSSQKFLDSILIDCPQREEWKNLMSNDFEKVFDKATTRDNPTEFFRTICHGDTWSNNMLYKYGDDGKPVSLVMVDLQILYCGLPTRDLGYFFCHSTSGELRKKHLKELLEFYRQELLKFLRLLGVSQITDKELSFNVLWKMYYETIHTGFFQAFCGLPVLLMPQEMQVESKEMKDLSLEEQVEALHNRARQSLLQNKKIRERFSYLIEEMVENKVF